MTVANLKKLAADMGIDTLSSSRPRMHSFRLSAPRDVVPVDLECMMVLNWQLRYATMVPGFLQDAVSWEDLNSVFLYLDEFAETHTRSTPMMERNMP